MKLVFIPHQLSSNGLISFGGSFTSYSPTVFPLSSNRAVVAPFWDDIGLTGSRELRYKIVSGSSSLITDVNNFLSSYSGIPFSADWLLWAYWYNVCPYNDNTCTSHQVNTLFIYIVTLIILHLNLVKLLPSCCSSSRKCNIFYFYISV